MVVCCRPLLRSTDRLESPKRPGHRGMASARPWWGASGAIVSPQQEQPRLSAGDEALSRTSTPPPLHRCRAHSRTGDVSTPPPVTPQARAPQTEAPTASKRRRLRQKTKPDPTRDAPAIWDLLEERWQALDVKYSLESRVKVYASSHFVQIANKHMEISGTQYSDRKLLFSQAFLSIYAGKLTNPFLCWQWWKLIKEFFPEYFGPPPAEPDFNEALRSKLAGMMKTSLFASTTIQYGALLTYNDDYCRDVPTVAALVKQYEFNPDKAVAAIRNIPEVLVLWEEMTHHCEEVVRVCGYANYSVAMELSLHALNAGRIHFHVYVSIHHRASLGVTWEQLSKQFAFKGRKPSHCAQTLRTRGRRSIEACIQQAHYYCQAPKQGQIFSTGSLKPFEDFQVTAKMVAELWKQHKLSTAQAMKEVLRTRDNVPKWFTEMLRTHNKESDASMKAAVEKALEVHSMSRFKPATPREIGFLKQFPHLPLSKVPGEPGLEPLYSMPQLRRYCFMVYDGRSRTGKTERAVAWWGDAATLVVNAQGTSTPSLRDWDSGTHKAIVYDEGSWLLPSNQRMLFQSGLRQVKMAQSNCNSECYDILLYGVPQLITSNNFWAGWDRTNDEHREARGWLEANMFYQVWNEPCWEETEAEGARGGDSAAVSESAGN